MKQDILHMAIPVAALTLCVGTYTAEARSQPSDRESSIERPDRQSSGMDQSSRKGRDRGGASSQSHSRWSQISGEVERAKKVTVRGSRQEHLAVLLTTEQGHRVVADLGPAKALRELQLQSGDWISARGPVVRVNDRRVLFAKQLRANGETIQIKRQSPEQGQSQQASQPVSGQVEMTKELKVKGTGKTHQVVRLKTQDGKQFIADLGAKKDLRDLNIKSGQQLSLQGPVLRLSGKPFIMAQQVSADNKTVQIDRAFMSAIPASRGGKTQSPQGGQQSISGEVIVKGEVLKVDRDGFYVVREPSGRQVHLLVAENMNRGFNVGDQIQAQVKQDGSVTSISKSSSGQQSSGQSSSQPSGHSSPQSTQSSQR